MKGRPQFAAWDVETRGLGGVLLAVTWCLEDGAPHYFTDENPDKISAHILDVILAHREYRWYAHNSQYDWRYLIPEIRRRNLPVRYMSRTETDVYGIVINPDSIDSVQTVDSYAVWPHSLEKLANSFCPELPKLKIDVAKFDPQNVEHIEYAKRDALALVTGLVRFDDAVFQGYGCHLNLTIASTAMQSWRLTVPHGESYNPMRRYESFFRGAYFGGMVLPLDLKQYRDCKTYDINSSYPAVMRGKLYPAGSAVEVTRRNKNRLGIYRVIVETPKNLKVPIIGYKDTKKKTKLTYWPSGIFETTTTSAEIDFAEQHGYKFEIIKGVEFSDTCQPFKSFVDKSEAVRKAHKGEPLEIVAKLIQNSLYGKFGSQRVRTRIIDSLTSDEDLIGAVPMSDDGLYKKLESSEDMICLPQWAAFITAYARISLLTTIYNVGVDKVLYADTDSVTVKSGVEIPTGTEYGQFKLEKEWEIFKVTAAKVYSGRLKSGEWKGVAKGLPSKQMGAAQWAALYAGQNVTSTYETLPSFLQFLKGNGNLKPAHREVTKIKNSINWRQTSNGETRPIHASLQMDMFNR